MVPYFRKFPGEGRFEGLGYGVLRVFGGFGDLGGFWGLGLGGLGFGGLERVWGLE